MSRFPHLAVALGLLFAPGCGSSEIESLRAAVQKHERAAKAAAEETSTAKAEAGQAREEGRQKVAYAEHLKREAAKEKADAQNMLKAAHLAEAAGKAVKADGHAALAEAKSLEAQVARTRLTMSELIERSRQTIKDAEKAKAEARIAQSVIDEVRRLSEAAREDRAAAEHALAEVAASRQLIIAERAAADKEQLAACAAVEAARLEKSAAADAVGAAKLAKLEIANDRKLFQEERSLVAAAREEVDQRLAMADAKLAKVELIKIAADQARAESIRQQILLSEQTSALEATKEAAATIERSAEQAKALASIERRAAERAKISADAAQQEANSANGYVSAVLEQLRETERRSSLKISEQPTGNETSVE